MTPNIDAIEREKLIKARMSRGQDTYAGRQSAWHAMGTVVGIFMTWMELLLAAKDPQGRTADFEVFKDQLEYQGAPIDSWGTFRRNYYPEILLDGSVNPARHMFLGDVGKDYQVIPHTSGFSLLDSLVGSIDGAHYETMGTLDYGRIVWGQVNPNIKLRVGDDETTVYLTFSTSHDGTKAFDIYESGERAVCRNTLRLASLKRLAASLRVRHSKNALQKIKDWQAELGEMQHEALSMQDKLRFLAERRVTKESLNSVMSRLFPMTTNEETGELQSSTRRDNVLAEVLKLYEYNDGDIFREQRGTAYNLLNAVTEYTDHFREERSGGQGRAVAAAFGSGDKLKTLALTEILKEANYMPERVQLGVGADVVSEMLLR